MDELDLPVSATSPAQARRFVDAVVGPVFPQAIDAAVLAVSELVTNAVRHAESAVTVRVWCTDASLRLEVSDDGPGVPAAGRPEDSAVHGRGLLIVDELSDRWGVDEDGAAGKTLWLELDRHAPAEGAGA